MASGVPKGCAIAVRLIPSAALIASEICCSFSASANLTSASVPSAPRAARVAARARASAGAAEDGSANLKESKALCISRSIAVNRRPHPPAPFCATSDRDRQGHVDAVKECLLLGGSIDQRLQALVVGDGGAWLRAEAARHSAIAESSGLDARKTDTSRREPDRIAPRSTRIVQSSFSRTPPMYSFSGCHGRSPAAICSGNTVGSPASSNASCVTRPGCRMVTVTVPLVALEPRNQHERPLRADDADDIT